MKSKNEDATSNFKPNLVEPAVTKEAISGMSEKEEKCYRVFEAYGNEVGFCVGIQLNPDTPNDFVNLCLREVIEEGGKKFVRNVESICMTLDEAAQLGLHLIECQYIFNQLKKATKC